MTSWVDGGQAALEVEGGRLRAELAAMADGARDLQLLVEALEGLLPGLEGAAGLVLCDRSRLAACAQRFSQARPPSSPLPPPLRLTSRRRREGAGG